jgi:NADH dehydrogenase [ubiquinone] 1 alpha subcomplex assembly factor 7
MMRHKLAPQLPLSLEEFMEQVLYDPAVGYYAQSQVIGKQQDFITAPELTPLFSQCLAQWSLDQWVNAGKPVPVNLIDLGAGRGTLLKDIGVAFQSLPELVNLVRPFILEKSPFLKASQQKTLAQFPSTQWVDSLSQVSPGYCIVLANEFFDALPIQYYRHTGPILEKAVIETFGKITWKRSSDTPLSPPTEEGIFLRSKAYETFVKQIAQGLTQNGGVGLVIDYGEESAGYTLQAVKNHQKVGFFDNLGQADLTHHVDFSYLKALFLAENLKVLGPQRQSDFLQDLGITTYLDQVKDRVSPETYTKQALAVHRLTSAAEMGQLFKVMAIQGT